MLQRETSDLSPMVRVRTSWMTIKASAPPAAPSAPSGLMPDRAVAVGPAARRDSRLLECAAPIAIVPGNGAQSRRTSRILWISFSPGSATGSVMPVVLPLGRAGRHQAGTDGVVMPPSRWELPGSSLPDGSNSVRDDDIDRTDSATRPRQPFAPAT